MLVLTAAVCGMSAIILAIMQLSTLPQPYASWIRIDLRTWETVAAVVALVAVVSGLVAAYFRRWLLEREKAEYYRLLKFHFLTSPKLWSDTKPEVRRRGLRDRMEKVNLLNKETLEGWAEGENDFFEDDPREIPEDMDKGVFEDLVDYYQEKRLCYQLHYFEKQAKRRHRWAQFTRVAPVVFFFLSILAALGHFVYDSWIAERHSPPELEGISLLLIMGAACFPVVGAAVRTLRTAHEFGRNVVRFRRVATKLEHLASDLQQQTSFPARLEILQSAEEILKEERREWLRLMIDAEWFG